MLIWLETDWNLAIHNCTYCSCCSLFSGLLIYLVCFLCLSLFSVLYSLFWSPSLSLSSALSSFLRSSTVSRLHLRYYLAVCLGLRLRLGLRPCLCLRLRLRLCLRLRLRLILRLCLRLRLYCFAFRRCSALRVPPAETRLTVYRRFDILLRSDRPSSGVREDRWFFQYKLNLHNSTPLPLPRNSWHMTCAPKFENFLHFVLLISLIWELSQRL